MEEIIFPNQIRMFRRAKGVSMKRLADLLGMSLSAISKIEKGYRRVNDSQMEKIANYFSCPKTAILISDFSSQPEVINAWEKEQERRVKINQGSGLKTLGAGLRYLRGQKALALLEIAKKAKLTLSVYHRIEMGQREVDEKTFSNIAHALGYSETDLQLEIYRLDMAGSLEELKKSEGKKSGLYISKGGYNDLPLSRFMIRTEVQDIIVPICGIPQSDGTVLIDRNNPSSSLVCPSTLAFDANLYAFPIMEGMFENIPLRSIAVVSPETKIKEGDLALLNIDEKKYKIITIQKTRDGNWNALEKNGQLYKVLEKKELEELHKIVLIMMA